MVLGSIMGTFPPSNPEEANKSLRLGCSEGHPNNFRMSFLKGESLASF